MTFLELSSAAVLLAGLGTVPAPADDQAGSSAAAAAVCDLNEGDPSRDEFSHCTDVVVGFASIPGRGDTTTVEVSLTAVGDVETGTLTLLVNDRLDVIDASGFAPGGTEPSGVGPMTTVSRTVSLTADVTDTFEVEVRGARPGTAVVQARFATAGARYDGGDEASVQLGQGVRSPPRGLSTARVPASAAPAPARIAAPSYRPAPVSGPRSLAPQAPGASCATGRWTFNDENGLQNPSANIQVQAWDRDTSTGDDYLATGITDSAGDYRVCFESTDGEGGGQEVYVRFVTENSAWRVRDTPAGNTSYAFSSGVQPIADPGTAQFGILAPTDPALHRALHAFDGINRLWQWHAGVHTMLDNPGDSRQMIVNWTPTSTDGTYYRHSTNNIHLAAADPDADHVTIHEGAHALMDAIYDDDMPPAPNCNPHSIFGPSSPGCAWTEGWAEWVPARVLDDPVYRFPNGVAVDLESPSWDVPATAYGDTTEGRVAGALIDLSDGGSESFWDRYGEGGSGAAGEEIYATNLVSVSDTFEEFFTVDRPGEGDTGFLARAPLFQNTIDYTHRDPLLSGQELRRPSLAAAPLRHNYSFASKSNFWGAVALLPPPGVAYDLRLYGDAGLSTLLATSRKGPGDVEYVVVDGNHRAGTFYPQVERRAGGGPYAVEAVAGGSLLARGTTTLSFANGEVVRAFEIETTPGVTEYLRVVPVAALDVDLHVHDSDGTLAGSVQDRSQSRTASTVAGAGEPEAVAHDVGESDRNGVVITNEAGSGSFTIYYDTVGPSNPSVVVDGGNPWTYDAEVALALSASAANGDGNTPVTKMQVSTDGTFDDEPWAPYATTAAVTLPGGPGSVSVSVRYRNAAGAISTVTTDTIELLAMPRCGGRTATVAGFGVVEGTPGGDVIVGGPGADRIRGRGGNDVICGRNGSDVIRGGSGKDALIGGAGGDALHAKDRVRRNDTVRGGKGRDTAVRDPGDAVVGVP